MQITHVEVVPVELKLSVPYRVLYEDQVEHAMLVFVRIDTQDGRSAWGCAAFDPALTGETLEQVTRACRRCAVRALDLNPLNTEFALAELEPLTAGAPSALCAFDIAFHDLLGLAAGLPLHRLLGGYPLPHPHLDHGGHCAGQRDRGAGQAARPPGLPHPQAQGRPRPGGGRAPGQRRPRCTA